MPSPPLLLKDNVRIIRIVDRHHIINDGALEVGCGQVCTLEGPNQAGKSLLLKSIVGTLPPGICGETRTVVVDSDMWVDVRHPRDASRHGIVAVHQDETLLQTMSIREQYLARHAPGSLKRIAMIGTRLAFNHIVSPRFDHASQIYCQIQDVVHRMSFNSPKEILQRAAALLKRFDYPGLLERTPPTLSGGERAVCRIVSALLHPSVRLLILDEPFAAVDRQRWPRILDELKQWVQEEPKQRAILVVSHSDAELVRWQADRRYRLESGMLRELPGAGYSYIFTGQPPRIQTVPVYEFPPPPCIPCIPDGKRPVIVTTSAITTMYKEQYNEHVFWLKCHSRHEPAMIRLPGNETAKTFESLRQLLAELFEHHAEHPVGAIVAIGGGALLNSAMLAAALFHRGAHPLIVVPTTLTALADVVVGSKGSINFTIKAGGSRANFKNGVGVFINPCATVVDVRLFRLLPPHERRLGLVECLKHGLLQCRRLYGEAKSLMLADDPCIDKGLDLAKRTMKLKAALLARFPWETGAARVLRFGHLHAHALERATDFTVSHAQAVLWGMLVDLKLAGADTVYEDLLKFILERPDLMNGESGRSISDVDPRDVVEAARTDHHEPSHGYSAIVISEIGCYGSDPPDVLNSKPVAEDTLRRTMDLVQMNLSTDLLW